MKPFRSHGDSAWIVCHLGAREHYAIPRALRMGGNLLLLVTDIWLDLTRSSLTRLLGRRGDGRVEQALQDVPRIAFTGSFLLVAALKRLTSRSTRLGDALTQFADRLFQNRAARHLAVFRPPLDEPAPVVFCYSYSAREIFRASKARGWITVLGQINPGPEEEGIVREVYREAFGAGVRAPAAPAAYWARWREECALADLVVANSDWSRRLLVKAGVEESKIAVVPLAYAPPPEAVGFVREYPEAFTKERPLRVLFLGAAHPRKGVHVLLKALARLCVEGAPVELLIVGRDEMPGGLAGRLPPNTQHRSEVDRRATGEFYRRADVFILPTFSDGFALTLLEAQAWQLPVIASRNCGKVIEHEVNGLELSEISEISIAAALNSCVNAPQRLREYAARRADFAEFSIEALGRRLREAVAEIGGEIRQGERAPCA